MMNDRSIAERELAQAAALVIRAEESIEEVRAEAAQLIDRWAEGAVSPDALGEAWRALAIAERRDRNNEAALAAFEAGLEVEGSSDGARGRLLISRSVLQAELHEWDAADADLARAESLIDPDYEGVWRFQRGTLYARRGNGADAEEAFDAALPLLQAHGHLLIEAHLLANRGLQRAYTGRYRDAESSLEQAYTLYVDLGLPTLAAVSRHNLGFVFGLMGDFVSAQRCFAEAMTQVDWRSPGFAQMALDYSSVLLQVGAAAEALDYAIEAAEVMEHHDSPLEQSEALLAAARAGRLLGAHGAARSRAAHAGELFTQAGRERWAGLARLERYRAAVAGGIAGDSAVETGLRLAAELDKSDQPEAARAARVAAAHARLDQHRADVDAILDDVDTDEIETADVAVAYFHARARAAADDRDVIANCQKALAAVRDVQLAVGAIDARAHASALLGDVDQLAISTLIEDDDVDGAVEWIEAVRATSLRAAPVRPPDDAALAEELADLRRLSQQIDQATLWGQSAAVAELSQKRRRISDSVAARARSAEAGDDLIAPAGVDELVQQLGRRSLISIVRTRDGYRAVRMSSRDIDVVPIGNARSIDKAIEKVSMSFRRMLAGAQPHSAGEYRRRVSGPLRDLGEALVEPLGLPPDELVLVPPPAMAGVPWGLLPPLRSVPLVVAPSATSWLIADRRASFSRPLVVVAGPGLEFAEQEIEAVKNCYERDQVLTLPLPTSTSSAVLAALAGAGTAHLSCHCIFGSGNALLSELSLADGPLFVHDIQRLEAVPRTVIVSACESARGDLPGGTDIVGLMASLLAMGSKSVIASVLPVVDAPPLVDFMARLHVQLADGAAPASALVEARAGLDLDDPRQLLVGAAFACFGAS